MDTHTISPCRAFWLVGFFLLSSCVSTRQALQEIKPGTTKQKVWDTLGKPLKVDRHEGRFDRWTYRFRWNSQEYTQDLFFDGGEVVKTGPLIPYPNYRLKMAEAESMEEYEMNAILYQRQRSEGFREINSVQSKTDLFCSHYFKNPSEIQQCSDVMRGKTFLPPALRFCSENIKGPTRLRLRGLLAIADRQFSPLSLNFCKKNIKGVLSKIKCLSRTADKEFKPATFTFCKRRENASQKLKCLQNAGYRSLTTPLS